MATEPVTLFQDCVFESYSNGQVRISNSNPIGHVPGGVTERLEPTEAEWRVVTHADTLDAARRIDQALLGRGLGNNRPVLILSVNDIEHALVSLAHLHVGAPVVPLSTTYSPLSSDHAELRDIAASVEPSLTFADHGSCAV